MLLTRFQIVTNVKLRLPKFIVEFTLTLVAFHIKKPFSKNYLRWRKGVRLRFMYFEIVQLFTLFLSIQSLRLKYEKSFLHHFQSQISC